MIIPVQQKHFGYERVSTADIIAFYLPMVDLPYFFTVYDIDDRIIICSNQVANELGYNSWQEIRGKEFKSIQYQKSHGRHMDKEFLSSCSLMRNLLENLHNLKRLIFSEMRPVSIIIIHPFIQIYKTFFLTTFFPIFNALGKVVAIQGIRTEFNFFELTQILGKANNNPLEFSSSIYLNEITTNYILPIQLTERQHEILFLLANGLAQEDVAALLKLSRGTIAKTLTQSICPKFDIWGTCTSILIERAKTLNIHKMLPKSFCQPKFIILDNQMALKYSALRITEYNQHELLDVLKFRN